MSDVQDYGSRLDDMASKRFETFSYLPQMSDEELRKQVEYIVRRGWNPAIEHSEPENAMKLRVQRRPQGEICSRKNWPRATRPSKIKDLDIHFIQ